MTEVLTEDVEIVDPFEGLTASGNVAIDLVRWHQISTGGASNDPFAAAKIEMDLRAALAKKPELLAALPQASATDALKAAIAAGMPAAFTALGQTEGAIPWSNLEPIHSVAAKLRTAQEAI